MKTLELKDIVGYLPYGMYYEYVIVPFDWDGFTELKRDVDEYNIWDYTIEIVDLLTHRPILRPLSDLYRTITHNGKEIVPIVECAKLSDNVGWHLNTDKNLPPAAVHGTKKDLRCYFMFNFGSFTLHHENPEYYQCEPYDGKVKNQVQLFDCLHELKIDYRGLIDAGLCVSCYDLEKNPYI
jgi:hypothetical protein